MPSGIAVPANAQDKADIEALRAQGYSVRMISPIFSQLVMLSLPKGFTTVFENTNGTQYTREAVPDGETVDRWSQMITVTGAKGLAANPRVTPQSFLEQIADGFKNACPATFSAKVLRRLQDQRPRRVRRAGRLRDGVVADGGAHSEAALLIAIKGTADYYTIQWAERGPASPRPMAFDDTKWNGPVRHARSDQALSDQAGRSAALSELQPTRSEARSAEFGPARRRGSGRARVDTYPAAPDPGACVRRPDSCGVCAVKLGSLPQYDRGMPSTCSAR